MGVTLAHANQGLDKARLEQQIAGQGAAAALPYRHVDVLSIQPSGSLDAMAQQHLKELPGSTRNALGALGVLRGGFIQALIGMGESDAYARKDELLAFFDPP